MPLEIIDHGENNQFHGPCDSQDLNGRIEFTGSGNIVSLGQGCVGANIDIRLENGGIVEIGHSCILGSLFAYVSRGGSVAIGAGTGINGYVAMLVHEPRSITVGRECLFASQVDITVSDMHSIIDEATGQRINPGQDISLGDRVWVGQRASILKGSRIGSDAVIGAHAVVTGDIPSNVIAAGVPARTIRTGISWRHELL